MTRKTKFNRRNVLRAIGSSATLAGGATAVSSAKTKPSSKNIDSLHNTTIDHDLAIFNRTSSEQQVTVEIFNKGGNNIENFEFVVSGNTQSNPNSEPWVTQKEIPQINGPVNIRVESEDQNDDQSMPLAPKGKRDHEAISITITQRRLLIGKIQI